MSLHVNCQQLGTDNVTYIPGTTTLDISRSIPVGLLVTGTVIFQVNAIIQIEMQFLKHLIS